MQNPQPSAPPEAAVVAITDANAYEHAVQAQHERSLGADFARNCLKKLGWSLILNVLQAISIGVLIFMYINVPREYIATEGDVSRPSTRRTSQSGVKATCASSALTPSVRRSRWTSCTTVTR